MGTGVVGVVLAAGAGSRMGRPKALLRTDDGTAWVALAVRALLDGGCSPVLVVLGAAAEDAAMLVPEPAVVVRAQDWTAGMSASLRAGLDAARATPGEAVVVTLVDTPGVTGAAVARLVAGAAPDSLARASYDGRPGHPVLLGRAHWDPLSTGLAGDSGARAYLARHQHSLVECADVADGTDIDTPDIDTPDQDHQLGLEK